jgi:hypothetical protein
MRRGRKRASPTPANPRTPARHAHSAAARVRHAARFIPSEPPPHGRSAGQGGRSESGRRSPSPTPRRTGRLGRRIGTGDRMHGASGRAHGSTWKRGDGSGAQRQRPGGVMVGARAVPEPGDRAREASGRSWGPPPSRHSAGLVPGPPPSRRSTGLAPGPPLSRHSAG